MRILRHCCVGKHVTFCRATQKTGKVCAIKPKECAGLQIPSVQLIEAGKTISHQSSESNAQAGHDGRAVILWRGVYGRWLRLIQDMSPPPWKSRTSLASPGHQLRRDYSGRNQNKQPDSRSCLVAGRLHNGTRVHKNRNSDLTGRA